MSMKNNLKSDDSTGLSVDEEINAIVKKGNITVDELKVLAKRGIIETVIVGFTDHVGKLAGKRYDVDFFINYGINSGGHCCDYLLTIDIEQNIIGGFEYSNWEKGYGDFHIVPDLSTLRIAAWLEKTAIVLCDIHEPKTHHLVSVAPRSILRKQVERAKKLGYNVFGASELEYYMYRTSYMEFANNHFSEPLLKPYGWYLEDYNIMQGTRGEAFNAKVRKYLKESGITVENSKGEYGIGQHELNISFSNVLDMSDKHVLYKQCLKETADKLGMSVTFMAKPHASQSGNSCHIHINLATDVNAFVGDNDFHGLKCSDVFKYFLGGCLKFLPEVMVFCAPTINSYKRYQSLSWAPTRLAWSVDNRTAGFRIVGQDSKSLRIECRIPGADCNPYLAFAAILACGLEGMEQKIEAPSQIKGDIYKLQTAPRVPKSLSDSISLFENSSFAKKSFGNFVVKHYTHFYKEEVEQYNRAVTDWERKRYFEQV